MKEIIRLFKADKYFNIFFILCFSFGIIGLILVESFKNGVEEKVSKNAKNLIASDLSIASRKQFSEKDIANILSFAQRNKLNYTQWTETYSLVRSEKISKLTNLNFVGNEFPYYGNVLFENNLVSNRNDWNELQKEKNIWISRDLSWELQVKEGEFLSVGNEKFKISKIFKEDKFSSFRGFSLAPKAFLAESFLKNTGLMQFGSTGSFAYLFKIDDSNKIETYKNEIRLKLDDPGIRIRGPKDASVQVGRSLTYLSDYLGLVTLLTYLLSLIGTYYFTHYFLSKNLKNIAIYKALGRKSFDIFKGHFGYIFVLSVASVFVSLLVMSILVPIFNSYVTVKVGEDFLMNITPQTCVKVLSISVLGSLFALFPVVLGAIKIPVNSVLKDLPQEIKRLPVYYYFPLLVFIIALSIFISHSIKIGTIFVTAVLLLLVLGFLFFRAFCKILILISRKVNFETRHGLLSLARYFNSSFTIFVCLMMGCSLIVMLYQIESSIRDELTTSTASKRPDLFMFDLQDVQEEDFISYQKDSGINVTMFSPMVRARLKKINEVIVKSNDNVSDLETREEQNQERSRTRGVNLSYRKDLSWSETIVKGKFYKGICVPEQRMCEISLEDSYAKRLGVTLGDKLEFDVSGVEVQGVITSLRKVKWTSFEPNFFILFQPGAIDDAPKTFLAGIKVKGEEEKRKIFNDFSQKLPGVSLLEVSEVINKIVGIFELMVFAVRVIAILAFVSALIVVWSVNFNHLELKKREMYLFHTLGVNSKKRELIYRNESFLQILISTVISIFSGSMITYLILNFGFNIEVNFNMKFILIMLVVLFISLFLITTFKIKRLISQTKSKEAF